jgi:hypothetical protein
MEQGVPTMTELERRERHEAAIARFNGTMGAAYRAWLDGQPRRPGGWMPLPAYDDTLIRADLPANDNREEAA